MDVYNKELRHTGATPMKLKNGQMLGQKKLPSHKMGSYQCIPTSNNTYELTSYLALHVAAISYLYYTVQKLQFLAI